MFKYGGWRCSPLNAALGPTLNIKFGVCKMEWVAQYSTSVLVLGLTGVLFLFNCWLLMSLVSK